MGRHARCHARTPTCSPGRDRTRAAMSSCSDTRQRARAATTPRSEGRRFVGPVEGHGVLRRGRSGCTLPVGRVHSYTPWHLGAPDVPRSGVLERMMSSTEVAQVVFAGEAAADRIVVVIDVAVACRDAAAGESPAHVSVAQSSSQSFRGSISVDGEQFPRDRMSQDTVPSGGGAWQSGCGIGVDRADTVELARRIARAVGASASANICTGATIGTLRHPSSPNAPECRWQRA